MVRLRLVLTAFLVLLSAAPSYAHGGRGGGRVFIGFRGFGCCFGGFWPSFGWGFAPPPVWAFAPPPVWSFAPPFGWGFAPPAWSFTHPAAWTSPPAILVPPPPPASNAPTPLTPQRAPSASPSGAATPPSQDAWYYCPTTSSYYPYVATCAVPWQTVPTTPPQLQAPQASIRPSAHAAVAAPPVRAADTPTEAFLRGLGGPRQGEPRLVSAFRNSSGQACQQLERSIVVDGIHQHATAIVCERADGRWVISPETVQEARN